MAASVAAVVLVAVVAGAAVYLLRPTSEVTPAQRALLAVLAAGYGSVNCVPAPEREGGRVDAAVTCVGGPANGPSSAVFLHYVDEASLRDAQLVEITARELPADGDVELCRDGTPAAGSWNRGSSVTGLLLCRSDAGAGAVIEWTETRARARGPLARSDGDATALYAWWSTRGFL